MPRGVEDGWGGDYQGLHAEEGEGAHFGFYTFLSGWVVL